MGRTSWRARTAVRIAAVLLGAAALAPADAAGGQDPATLPTMLEDFRFLLEATAEPGVSMLLRIDTGGRSFLVPEAAHRLAPDLPPPSAPGSVGWPAFGTGEGIPPPPGDAEGAVRLDLLDDQDRAAGADGVLGADWLHGRTWTFDYPGRRLVLREPGDLPLHGAEERVALELPASADGTPLPGAPLIRVRLGGRELAVALETDARARLSPGAVAEMADFRPEVRAISRLAGSVFDRLRTEHPDWRVVDRAEPGTGQPVLEVRDLRVAGVTIERLWVLRDPSEDPGQALAAGTARAVAGVLGGDVLREFRLTLDYRGRTAVFEPAGFP